MFLTNLDRLENLRQTLFHMWESNLVPRNEEMYGTSIGLPLKAVNTMMWILECILKILLESELDFKNQN